MRITELEDVALVNQLKMLAGKERKITVLILDYLREVEARRLFLSYGCSNLFDFATQVLGYSEGSANRRISAMRSIRDLPEARAKLAEGSVNLTTLSLLHSFSRKENKVTKGGMSHADRLDLLNMIDHKSQKACVAEFAKLRPDFAAERESTRPITETLTQLKFAVPAEFLLQMEELRELLGNRDVGTLAQLFCEIMKVARKQLETEKTGAGMRVRPVKKIEAKSKEVEGTGAEKTLTEESVGEVTAAAAVIGKNDSGLEKSKKTYSSASARYISAEIKREIWRRDKGECQFYESATGKTCGSRHAIQYDHVFPVAQGGRSTSENLRLLCRHHNQVAAADVFSRKHLAQFVRSLS